MTAPRAIALLSALCCAALLSGPAQPAQVTAIPVTSPSSGPVPVEVTLGSGTLASGNALGLFIIPIGRIVGGSNIITNFLWKSVNGDTTIKQGRLYSAKPVNTTCNNGSAFVGSDVDDAYLIGPGPFTFTPAAPTVTTGDSATYANLTSLTWDFHNQDSNPAGNAVSNAILPSINVYLCVIAGASDTLDVSHAVRATLSGPQN